MLAQQPCRNVNTVKPRGSACVDRKANLNRWNPTVATRSYRVPFKILRKDLLLDRSELHSATLDVKPIVQPVIHVVHYAIAMPYVDGRVSKAIEEMRPGVGQICLPCIFPVQPTSPNPGAPNYCVVQ